MRNIIRKIKREIERWHRRIDELRGKSEPDPTPDPTPEPPSGETPINRFLWKPVSESRGGRAAVLLPARIEAATITVNGQPPAENRGRTNGHRLTFFLAKTGAAYGSGVIVKASNGESWTVPNGANRFER